MKLILTLGFLIILSGCVTAKVNEAPTAGFKDPPWVWHTCLKCGSLDGGCYPKNTTSSYRTDKGKKCIHQWKRITKEDYNQKWEEQTGEDRSIKETFDLFGTNPQPVARINSVTSLRSSTT